MDEERIEEQEQEQAEKKPYRPGAALKFAASLLFACLTAAGLLMLLAWVSYQMRFSAEVVRAGIMGLYIVPCLVGGRVIKGFKLTPAPLWGAGLGAAYYGVLLAVSWWASGMNAARPDPAQIGLTVPVLCGVSGLLGSLFGRKKQNV